MARKLRLGLPRARRAADANAGAAIQSPLRDSPSFLVRMAQLSAFDEFYRHFAGLNMTPARFSVFVLIVHNPGVRPGALTEELRVKPSNIAALVNALVADGFVERRQDKKELRANMLFPTKAGLKAFKEMWTCNAVLRSTRPLVRDRRSSHALDAGLAMDVDAVAANGADDDVGGRPAANTQDRRTSDLFHFILRK